MQEAHRMGKIKSADHLIAELATRQHGVISSNQAIEAGLSRSAIQRRVENGRWQRVGSKTFQISGTPTNQHTWIYRQVMAIQPAWVSHATAARLWGWEVQQGPTEVLCPFGRRRDLRLWSHESTIIEAIDQATVDGIPVTSPARTIVDLSGRFDPTNLGKLFDHAVRLKQVAIAEVADCADRLRKAPGRRPLVVQAMLSFRTPNWVTGDSPLEDRVLAVMERAGLPRPHVQYPVDVGSSTLRIDIAYPELMIAIEALGFTYHGDRSGFDRDAVRNNLLQIRGWVVIEITAAMTDDQILETIVEILDERSNVSRIRPAG